jgi:hypothetical protein
MTNDPDRTSIQLLHEFLSQRRHINASPCLFNVKEESRAGACLFISEYDGAMEKELPQYCFGCGDFWLGLRIGRAEKAAS